jgi:endonuclease/exonuclease/phosphatase (EEP) superfamily protein YafD
VRADAPAAADAPTPPGRSDDPPAGAPDVDADAGRRWVVLHGALVLATAGAVFLLPGGAPWPLTLPANLLHVLGLAALAFLPVCVARRWARTAVLQLAALAVGVACLLGGRGAAGVAPAEDAEVLRVVSLNLGVGLAESDDIARLLAETDADVAILQELTTGVAAGLERDAAAAYPHRALRPGGVNGKGVLSRHPIVDAETVVLEEGRSHLRCTLDVDGTPVEVFDVHFSPALGVFGMGAADGRDLARIAASEERAERVLIAGDFNSTWRSGVSAWLEGAGWREAFRESGAGPAFTFPVFGRYFGFPVGRFLRIDQVWCSPGLRPVSARVGPDVGSDHRPLVTAFAVVEPSGREGR